jgi:hypothetical protein
MSDLPTFPVLKLLTDEEIERALSRHYSLQEGPDGHDYLRSDQQDANYDTFDQGICFLGEALGLPFSPGVWTVADHLVPRTDLVYEALREQVWQFMWATDLVTDVKITDDDTLRAIVAASRAAP